MTPHTSAALADISKAGGFANEAVNKMVHCAAPSLPKELDVSILPNQKPYVTVAGTEVKTATAHYFTNNKRMIKKFEKFKIAKNHHIMKPLAYSAQFGHLFWTYPATRSGVNRPSISELSGRPFRS
jgi:hypothetical protein